jgi:hypothetical protein
MVFERLGAFGQNEMGTVRAIVEQDEHRCGRPVRARLPKTQVNQRTDSISEKHRRR